MAFQFQASETFNNAKEKIENATNRSTKTATVFKKYMIAVLNTKFGRHATYKDFKIGARKREEWSKYVKEISDFQAIVPVIDKNSAVPTSNTNQKKSYFSYSEPSTQLTRFNFSHIPTEEVEKLKIIRKNEELSQQNLLKAEKLKKDMVLRARQNDKRFRQQAIDEANREIKEKYLKELAIYKDKMQKLMDETKQVLLVEVDSRECMPARYHPDRDYKILDPKLKFKGRFSNGMFRSIKHVTNRVPGEEYFEYKYDTSLRQDQPPETFYFHKYLQLTNQAISTKINLDELKEPEYLPDAVTEKTQYTNNKNIHDHAGSSLDLVHDKVPYPQTELCTLAEQNIKKWQMVKRHKINEIANIELNDNKKSFMSYNKFIPLRNYKADWKVHKLANYKKDEVLTYNDNNKLENKKTKVTLSKRQMNNRKEMKRKFINSKTVPNQLIKYEAKISFINMMTLILNSILYKRMKLKDENQLTEEALVYYVTHGHLTKQLTGLEKGRRLQMQRIISDFFISRYSEPN